MKKLILLPLICLFLVGINNVQAQTAEQPLGFKVFFGTQAFDGDLGNEMFEYSDSDFTYGFGLAAYLNSYFDLSLDLSYMTLDKVNGPNDSVFKKRNTSFSTHTLNLNLMLRFKPFQTRLNPYLAAGVGYNHFTDNQDVRDKDSYGAFAIPFGIGVNYQLTDHTMLNAQMVYNRTFTDAIDSYPLSASDASDGVAPRSNIDNKNHDDFMTTTIGLVFNFGGGENHEMTMEEKMLQQSMKNLQAAENSSNKASQTLDQAQQLNDKTLAALDELREAMKQTPQQSNDLKAEMVRIVNNIQFEFDKSDIIDPAHDELNSLANIMKTYPKLAVNIEGHADKRGSSSYNQALSQRRAQAVRDYLVNQGVDGSRITTHAEGENNPLMSGSSATSYGQNRSVRLTLSYSGGM